MLRFVYYELKAMFRYSSGAKRRWISIIALAILPIYFYLMFYFTFSYIDLRGFVYRYSLMRLLFIGSILTSGGVAINIGRVSKRARELVYSSPLSESKLFLAFFLIVIINSLPVMLVMPEIAYFISSWRGFAISFIYTIIGILIGYASFSPAKRARELIPHASIIAILAALPYYEPEYFRPINDFLLGYFYDKSLLSGLSLLVIAIPLYFYGKRHVRDILVWQEAISKLGKLKRASVYKISIVYLLRYPSVLSIILLPPVVIIINIFLARIPPTLEALSSAMPIIGSLVATVILFGLSRELGRRDLRLSAPKDYYPFRVRLFLTYLMIISSGIAISIIGYPNIIDMLYAFIISLGIFSIVGSASIYYAVGSAKPIKGSLQDAFRAPLFKQLFIGIIIGIISGILAAAALFFFPEHLQIILSLAYLGVSYFLSILSEKRFLRRARS